MVDGLNARDKRILKLSMENILNTELIRYDSIFFKFMQVHENEEDQDVSVAKEAKCVLLLLHTIDKDSNK